MSVGQLALKEAYVDECLERPCKLGVRKENGDVEGVLCRACRVYAGVSGGFIL